MAPDGQGSVVTLEGSIEINGALASLVTTGASIVVSRMTKSFTTSLAATCAQMDGSEAR